MGDQRKIRGLGLGPVAPVFDFRAGEVRRQAEARGVAQILARATPPEVCGPDIPVSPARGGMRAFMPFEQVGNARIATGYRARGEDRPRQAVARLDVWDRMEAVAREVHARVEGAPAFVPPFTPAQVAMARAYRDLVERYDASGMRCSSVEARTGGGGERGVSEAVAADGARLAQLHRRIGDGVSVAVRRVRPSDRGARLAIKCRVLVDAVALGDRTLSQVLRAHGWAVKGAHREALRWALGAVLDRMMGYDLSRDTR